MSLCPGGGFGNNLDEQLRQFAFAGDRARGVDVDRYSFIVSDSHRLLVAGLPAHCERFWTIPGVLLTRRQRAIVPASTAVPSRDGLDAARTSNRPIGPIPRASACGTASGAKRAARPPAVPIVADAHEAKPSMQGIAAAPPGFVCASCRFHNFSTRATPDTLNCRGIRSANGKQAPPSGPSSVFRTSNRPQGGGKSLGGLKLF